MQCQSAAAFASPRTAAPRPVAQAVPLCSLVLADFPPIAAEFGVIGWTLLSQGSRDGHATALSLIRDTDENVVVGFALMT
jgi:hypothetical protein